MRRTSCGGPHTEYTSRSAIPGLMVPVSGEEYGLSCTGPAADAAVGGGGGGACGRAAARARAKLSRRAESAAACCAGVPPRFLVRKPLILSHPKVATAKHAHITSRLRRIAFLQREKDTGTVLAAQDRSV